MFLNRSVLAGAGLLPAGGKRALSQSLARALAANNQPLQQARRGKSTLADEVRAKVQKRPAHGSGHGQS